MANDSTQPNKKVARGRQSPAFHLEDTIGMLRKIDREIGGGPFNGEAIALALGHKSLSGPASAKIGSLTHFNMLERSKGSYSVSALGRRIIFPAGDSEVSDAIVDAAGSPSLYHELLERFQGKSIPNQLGNILAQEFGVLPKRREEVANTFKITMEFAGLLRHGVLHESVGSTSHQSNSTCKSNANGNEPVLIDAPANNLISPRVSLLAEQLFDRSADCEFKSEVFALETGAITVQWPNRISSTDYEDIEAWIEILIRKIKRSVSLPSQKEENDK